MTATLFIPEIIDQHYENAASLWLARDNAVGRSSYRLADLIKLDERLEANIDGLRVAAARGWSASVDELDRGGVGEFFTATVLALESGDSSRFDDLVERAYAMAAKTAGEPYHPPYDPWRGMVSALAWVDRSYASSTVARLLDTPRPRTRWLGLAACGARRAVRQAGIEAALVDHDPLVRARAARSIGELGRADLRAGLRDLLADPEEDCRFWAAWSCARLGVAEGLSVLSDSARSAGPRREAALDLLLRCLSVESAHGVVVSLARGTLAEKLAIRACAIIGDARYLPWLVEQLGDPKVARVAAEAFVTITGAEIGDMDRAPPSDLERSPNDDLADDAVALDDDQALAWPDPAKLGQWWRTNTAQFAPGTAYFMGSPKAAVNWIGALSHAVQRQRRAAARELALRQPARAMFEVRARGAVQQGLLRRAGGSP
jgi:uncharacterized protein (TIGR02270 family)